MINFPSNPTTGDVYPFQGRIWRWNGVSWRTIASSYSGNVIIIGGGGSGNVVSVNGQTGVVTLSTADITEQDNLYFTNARVYANIIGLGYATNTYINTRLLTKANTTDLTTSNIVEGSNLYFTNTRAILAFTSGSGISIASNGQITSTATGGGGNVDSVNGLTGTILLTTANISEQSNLYFTNTRVYANVIELGYANTNTTNTISNNLAIAWNTANSAFNKANIVPTQLINGSDILSLDGSNKVNLPGNTAYIFSATNNITLSPDASGDNSFELINNVGASLRTDRDFEIRTNTGGTNRTWTFTLGGSLFFPDSTFQTTAFSNTYLSTRLATKANVADLTTANISELTNLYYTNARVYDNVITLGYATNAYVNTGLLTKANTTDLTTSNIVENGNLYFTNTRVISALTPGTGIVIESNGRISGTAVSGVSSVNGASGDVQLFYYSNTAPNINTSGAIWYKGDGGNVFIFISDGTSNEWIEIDQGGILSGVTSVNGLTGTILLTTANISEQSNLYFTNARVYDNVITLGYATNTYVNERLVTKANVYDLTTANISELSNLYYTNARVYDNVITLGYATNTYVNTRLTTKANVNDLTTSNVVEGTNLYFTNARAAVAISNATISNITVSGNVVAGNFNSTGVVTANAATAFKAGDAAISGVALEIPREGGIRNMYNGDNTMYFDVSNGGSTHGHFSFRGTSSFTQYAKIDNSGIDAITSYKGKAPFNSALDTVVTVDNLKFRISNQGGVFPQVASASGSTVDIAYSAVGYVNGTTNPATAHNSGYILAADGTWLSLYSSHGLDDRGDYLTFHLVDKNAGKIYRVTYMVTNNSSNTTGYNILVERII